LRGTPLQKSRRASIVGPGSSYGALWPFFVSNRSSPPAPRVAAARRSATLAALAALAALLPVGPAAGAAGAAGAAPARQGPAVGFAGVQEGQAVRGTVAIQALVAGPDVAQVEFALSGPAAAAHAEGLAPYTFMGDVGDAPLGWDTTGVPDGEYTLAATATDAAGRTSTSQVRFRVAN
jgi:hypothetical protein